MKPNLLMYRALLICIAIATVSCEYDNYEGPGSRLQGRIVYKGDAIGVSYNDVNFELWEPGWKKRTPINVSVDQDGEFSQRLFDATYKLIIPSYQGPFISIENDETGSDTILIQLQGNKVLDIEVMPYYMIRDAGFTLNNKVVSAHCRLEKVITGVDERNIERVVLYISKTYFVDERTSISSKSINAIDITDLNNVSLHVGVPDMNPSQHYVYARIGVKINGVADMLFSPIQKLDF